MVILFFFEEKNDITFKQKGKVKEGIEGTKWQKSKKGKKKLSWRAKK